MANIIRIKRRAGSTGAPSSLYNGELAFNENDAILYYGSGNSAGLATSIIAIGGAGAFVSLSANATITGTKDFTGTITVPTQLQSDNSTKAASTAYVRTAVAAVTSTFTVTGNAGSFSFATGSTFSITGDGTILSSTATQPSGSNVTVSLSIANNSIPNSKLVNSAVTLGSTSVSLGGTATTIAGLTSITGLGTLALRDTSAAFDVSIGATSSTALTAARALTLDVVNASRTLKLGGNIDIAGNFTTSGANALTLTTTGATNVTLPTSGTLVNTAVTSLSSLATVGTITSGTWNGSIISPTYGGTGVNNGSSTITLGGNLTTSGAFTTTLTVTGNTSVTLPTSGTLVNTAVTSLSSLSTVGTITSGTWNAGIIPVLYGGTGTSTGSITGTGALTFTAGGTNTNVNLVPNGTGVVDVNGARITLVGTPVAATDAVTKQYADAIAQSLNVHAAADYATTTAVSYTYASGGTALTITTITGTDTITFSADHGLQLNAQIRTGDVVTGTGLAANTTYYVTAVPSTTQVKVSVTYGGSNAVLTNGTGLSIGVTGNPGVGATLTGTPNALDGSGTFATTGLRILVKDHTTASYNGVYTITTIGTGANGVWTRATDFDNAPTGEISPGDFLYVTSGTVNGGNGFVQTQNAPIRMGVAGAGYTTFTGDSIAFTQFSGAGQITAGLGLTKTGNTLDVNVASGRTVINGSDQVDLATVSQSNTSGSAGINFVQSHSVDAYGRVTGTVSADVRTGSTTQTGILQVTDSVASTSTTTAASPNSVKTAYDLANAALPKSGGTMTGKITLVNASSSTASINYGTGTADPTTPATGDSWNNSGTLKFYNGTATKTIAFTDSNITGTAANVTGTVAVANGGTGLTTLTTNGVVYGNGTSAAGVTAAGAWDATNSVGEILSVNASGVPTWTNTIDGGTY